MEKSSRRSNAKYLTSNQVEEMTSIPVGTLSRWRCIGIGIPFHKLGPGPKARVRYDVADVIAFMNEGKRYPSVRAHMEDQRGS